MFLKDISLNYNTLSFYAYYLLRKIAFIISFTFIPIFLFIDLGYSLFQVCLFVTIVHAMMLPFVPFTEKVIEKVGLRKTISLHVFGMALFFYLLQFLSGDFKKDVPFILMLACIKSIPKAFFSTAEVTFIAKEILKTEGNDGKNLSIIEMTLIAASILAPLIGGFLSYTYGFLNFFTIIAFFTLISAVPLMFGKDIYIKSKNNYFQSITFMFSGMNKYVKRAEFGKEFSSSINQAAWPIFIILIVSNTLDMGIILSISAFIGIMVSRYIGRHIDAGTMKDSILFMTKFTGIVFFIRILFPNPLALLVTDSINKLSQPLLLIPYRKYYYNYVKSFKDSVFGSTVCVLYSECIFLIGFTGLSIYFGIIEFLGIPLDYIVFLPIFALYGSSILLMKNIKKLNL